MNRTCPQRPQGAAEIPPQECRQCDQIKLVSCLIRHDAVLVRWRGDPACRRPNGVLSAAPSRSCRFDVLCHWRGELMAAVRTEHGPSACGARLISVASMF